MTTNILVLLGGAGLIQSLFLSACVLTSALRKQLSNILLLILNFFILVFLANSLYLFLSAGKGLEFVSSFSLASLALIGPLSFFYVKAFLSRTYTLRYIDVLHVMPVLLPVGFGMGFYKPYLTLVGAYIFVYLFFSLVKIHQAEISARKRIWIYSLLGGISLLTLLVTFFSLGKLCIIGILIGFTVVTYLVSYLAIRLYQDVFLQPKESPAKNKFATQGSTILFNTIDEHVTIQKLYTDPELTLTTLATKLGIHTHKLSYVINSQKGMSFTDYINGLRVEQAKRNLLGSDTKVAAIAFECGFNSLSTFYSTFKKLTGLSPSEFRATMPE